MTPDHADGPGWGDWIDETLGARRDTDLLRALDPLTPTGAVTARDASGRDLTLFSANDYLGLAHHPEVREAVARAARDAGLGPRGSSLVCGYTDAHDALAHGIARLKRAMPLSLIHI